MSKILLTVLSLGIVIYCYIFKIEWKTRHEMSSKVWMAVSAFFIGMWGSVLIASFFN